MPEEPTAAPPDDQSVDGLLADALSQPVADEPAPDTTPDVPDTADAGGEGEEVSDGAIRQYFVEEYGEEAERILGKYGDDRNVLRGLYNAAKMVGQRDQDAELGRQLRPYARQIAEYLQGGGQAPAPAQAGQSPPAAEMSQKDVLAEFQELRQRVLAVDPSSGQAVYNPQSSAGDRQRYLELVQTIQKRQVEFGLDPERALGPVADKIAQRVMEQVWGQMQQGQAVQQEDTWLHQYERQNSPWMYVNGNPELGFTPAGQEFLQRAQTLVANGATRAAAVQAAHEIVAARYGQKAPAAAATKPPVKNQGRRRADVANPPPPDKDDIPDDIAEPGKFEAWLRQRMNAPKK